MERVFFPLMPFCSNLSDKEKQRFHEKVDRSSTSTKIGFLIKQSDDLIDILIHENRLRDFFDKNRLLGFLDRNQWALEYIAFAIAIAINFIILVYYSREFDQHILGGAPKITIFVLGICLTFLASLVWVLMTLKRGPIICKYILRDYARVKKDEPKGFFIQFLRFVKLCVLYLLKCLTDFDYLYQTVYIVCSVLGLVFTYIFYMFHMSDLLRIDLLNNVVSAIWIRRVPLLLTFLLYLLFQYYFTLIGYSLFYTSYPDQRCNKLWECFFNSFDL